MAGQPWPDDIKLQALALAHADGVKLASEVTMVPERTIRSWLAGNSGNDGNDGNPDGQAPDQRFAVSAPVGALPDGEDKKALPLPSGDPALELLADLRLARQVYRTQAEKFLEGRVTSATYRDALVSLGIVEDKVSKRGLPGVRGGDFDWRANRAQARANIPLLRKWLASVKERIALEGGTWTP